MRNTTVNFLETYPICFAAIASVLIGFPIAGAVIYLGRRNDWFGGGSHVIGRKEFEKRLEDVFSGRESLDSEDFYSRFFAKTDIPKYIPIRLRKIFEEHLNADFSRIAANDDFSKELSCLWDFDSLANVEILIAIEKEFGVSFSDAEAEETTTLFRLAELIAQKRIARE